MAKHSIRRDRVERRRGAGSRSAAADAPRHGFFVRLYTGTGAFEVIGRRKLWYSISG